MSNRNYSETFGLFQWNIYIKIKIYEQDKYSRRITNIEIQTHKGITKISRFVCPENIALKQLLE